MGDVLLVLRALGIDHQVGQLGDTGTAEPLLDALTLERPEHTEVYRLQARMAWERGDAAKAAEFMTLARNGAGEAWNDEDQAALERYRSQ